METLSKWIDILRQPGLLKAVLAVLICWLVLNLICWVLGAIGLYTMGHRRATRPYFPAFLPGGQVWYTLHLAGKDRLAARAELLLWWCPTLAVAGGAAVVWAAVRYLDGGSGILLLLGLAAVLLLAALGLYIWCRRLEFRGLSRIFTRRAWVISLIGTVFGVPVQRLILFAGRNQFMK